MENYILITGASSGIGRECAIKLSEKYNLLLCARRLDKLQETQALCKRSEEHKLLQIDLSKIYLISDKLNKYLLENDIVISKFLHCAGCLTLLPAKAYDIEICNNIFNTNVFSAMAITKVLLKKNNKKALNNIVFISSFASKFAAVGNSFYASSKGALDSYMKSIAKELAPKVRVNSILPGAIDTAIMNTTDIENQEKLKNNCILGLGETKDIANMAEFLLSDKAKWITGQQYSVDGGASI